MRMLKGCLVSFVIALFASGPLAAAPILWIDDANGTIGRVDVATGTPTLVGSSGVALTDIGFDPSGNLWGISFTNLYSINKATGAATNVGLLGLSGANALVFASDGTLYTAATNTNGIYSVNTATGAATLLGNTGFSSAGDLAFNGGNLYLTSTTNQLIRINLANPALSAAVGPLGFSNVFGLATADNGITYGVSGTQIFSVNLATGAGTLVTSYGAPLSSANGTAFITEAAPAQVPEPASLSLLALGVIAAALARKRV